MDEQRRLELIAEAVRYCQRVKAMWMPILLREGTPRTCALSMGATGG